MKHTKQISVFVTEDQWQLFASQARKLGVGVSTWLRHCAYCAAFGESPMMVGRPLEEHVLFVLADAHPEPVTRDELLVRIGGSVVALRGAIAKVEAAGGARRVMNGRRSVGWVITEEGLAAVREENAAAGRPT